MSVAVLVAHLHPHPHVLPVRTVPLTPQHLVGRSQQARHPVGSDRPHLSRMSFEDLSADRDVVVGLLTVLSFAGLEPLTLDFGIRKSSAWRLLFNVRRKLAVVVEDVQVSVGGRNVLGLTRTERT